MQKKNLFFGKISQFMLDRVYYDNFGINVCNTHRINTILEERKKWKETYEYLRFVRNIKSSSKGKKIFMSRIFNSNVSG